MKWLFAILTIAIEILLVNFLEKYFIVIFIVFGMAGLFIKSINKNNSSFQNKIAWGILVGTGSTIVIYGILMLWLLKQLTYITCV